MPASYNYIETKREEALISLSFDINETLIKHNAQVEKMERNSQMLHALVKQCELSKKNDLIYECFSDHLALLTDQVMSYVVEDYQSSMAAVKEIFLSDSSSEKTTILLASLLYKPLLNAPKVSDFLDIIKLELKLD